jgi:serine/threonine-protein kinase HipA
MKIESCSSCLKPHPKGFCTPCRKRLFDGAKVSPILPFSLPEFVAQRQNATKRISISGVQPKYSLKRNGRELEFTDHGGEYILKPMAQGAFDHMEAMPANEHVTMQIARQVFKIPTAECALLFLADGETPCYLTRRFDVLPDGTRTLQEDFAQVAQVSEPSHGKNFKYDSSYEKIGALMKNTVDAYAVEVEDLFRLIIFNYLIHNGDAHIKNFSLFRDLSAGMTRLTPAYDLLNTRLHLPNESAMALDLFNDHFTTASYDSLGFYSFDDFHEFGLRLGISPTRIARQLEGIVSHEAEIHELLNHSFLPAELVGKYKEMVTDRHRALRTKMG